MAGSPCKARLTVAVDTPTAAATSFIVTRLLMRTWRWNAASGGASSAVARSAASRMWHARQCVHQPSSPPFAGRKQEGENGGNVRLIDCKLNDYIREIMASRANFNASEG